MTDYRKCWWATETVKGSHCTVYTYGDGSTSIEWDDEALKRDVKDALDNVNKPRTYHPMTWDYESTLVQEIVKYDLDRKKNRIIKENENERT